MSHLENSVEEIPETKTKRPHVAARMAARFTHDRSCVTMKLSTICRHEWFTDGLRLIVFTLNQVLLEAYQMANYCILRGLEAHVEVKLDQTLFARCCASSGLEVHSFLVKTPQDHFMVDSIRQWRVDRRRILGHVADAQRPSLNGLSRSLHNLAREMHTCAHTDILVNTRRRIFRMLKVYYDLNLKQAWRYLYQVFAPQAVLSPQDQRFKEWLVYFPSDENIKAHLWHFLKIGHHILRNFWHTTDQEVSDEGHKDVKGVRFYTLLPLKQGFSMSHIMLTNTTLIESLKWISQHYHMELPHLLNIHGLTSQNLAHQVDAVWRHLFHVAPYEKSAWTFAYVMTTDGYGASVHRTRIKPDVFFGPAPRLDPICFTQVIGRRQHRRCRR